MSALKTNRVKHVGVAAAVVGLAAGLALWGGPAETTAEAAPKEFSKPTKNVIVMISDGWGYNQIAATNYYTGQKQAYEKFPLRLAMSTYEDEGSGGASAIFGYDPLLAWTDFGYNYLNATDSASAGTAMASGVKTHNGKIGVDIAGEALKLVTKYAEEAGKSTGVVSSVQWTHATPASFVAHNVSRNNYAAIAQEMINASATDVIMGAGHPSYNNNGTATGSISATYVGGATLWAQLQTDAYAPNDADGDGIHDAWTLIETKAEFEALANAKTTPKRICGTAQVATTLQQSRSGDGKADPYVVPFNSNVPDLATMTKGALNVLDGNDNGFFLMIEGGAVDWAGHANQTGRLIEEQADFNKAVEAVLAWVQKYSNWGETLLVVTGDHETGYLWGPGSGTVDGVAAYNPVVNLGKGVVPGVSWNSGDHTNQIIPLFAKGDAAQPLKWMVDGDDPVRGKYIDNTDLGNLLIKVIQ